MFPVSLAEGLLLLFRIAGKHVPGMLNGTPPGLFPLRWLIHALQIATGQARMKRMSPEPDHSRLPAREPLPLSALLFIRPGYTLPRRPRTTRSP